MRSTIILCQFILLFNYGSPADVARDVWPYNLPPGTKYFPEDEPRMRHFEFVQERIASEKPVAVRKMSHDQGEMFKLEYWGFNNVVTQQILSLDETVPEPKEVDALSNATLSIPHRPPFLLHSESAVEEQLLFPRSPYNPGLEKRDFSCLSGTYNCSGIKRPNACCPNGYTCNIIPRTGAGDVGCCKQGSTCVERVSDCPSGYPSCPEQGGGCCVPGTRCNGFGCLKVSTTTVIVQPTITLAPSSSTIQSSAISSSIPTTTTSTTSSTTVPPSTTSTPPPGPICSPGFRSCPASLGGGCCSTAFACGDRVCPATTTTLPDEVPPVLQTSISQAIVTRSTDPVTVCPTGFYQCSAYYNGGDCCQVGRDCTLTSCPPKLSTTIVVSDGVTIVATPTVGSNLQIQGSCANGWFICGSEWNGGCCPSQYACGPESCTLVATATSTQTRVVAKKGDATKPDTSIFVTIFIAFLSMFL